ncbi:glycosyltransferase family 2 protein [Methanobrevibacter sp. YE315]|uniref:glycosyltransferase family 2 protein n=1 Tax=Methanobrevibacter sp. YE315 TaxID=1609968 RepID=UPI000835ECF5|nr:glycosyltransferase family 2 protein [Methanobrevibacter sp. YE315]
MEKISIVIPCYNMEKLVAKCISSIKNQSYTNFEAIFVDDGSQDSTEKVIKENIKDDERMKYVYKENGGLSSARNFGLEISTGKYICFIDSDDYIDKDYLMELYNNLIENDSDISICYFYRVYDKKTELNKVKEGFYNLVRFPAAWNKLYKTSLFKENDISFPLGKWYEDLGTFPKLLMKSKKISIVKKPLYYYIQHSSSIMHTYDDRIYQIYDITETNEDFAKKNDIFNKYYDELEYINVYHILVGTVYRSSFRDDFNADTIKEMVNYVNEKYPNWHENKGIKQLPLFYRIYLKALHHNQYGLIIFLLKTLNSKINVS